LFEIIAVNQIQEPAQVVSGQDRSNICRGEFSGFFGHDIVRTLLSFNDSPAKNGTGCAILTSKAKVFAGKAASEGIRKSREKDLFYLSVLGVNQAICIGWRFLASVVRLHFILAVAKTTFPV